MHVTPIFILQTAPGAPANAYNTVINSPIEKSRCLSNCQKNGLSWTLWSHENLKTLDSYLSFKVGKCVHEVNSMSCEALCWRCLWWRPRLSLTAVCLFMGCWEPSKEMKGKTLLTHLQWTLCRKRSATMNNCIQKVEYALYLHPTCSLIRMYTRGMGKLQNWGNLLPSLWPPSSVALGVLLWPLFCANRRVTRFLFSMGEGNKFLASMLSE